MTTTQHEIERWDRTAALIAHQVDLLNEALGVTAPDVVTFGYIGNGRPTPNGWDLRGVRWFVFLPHPGRAGTADDQLGGVDHHDVAALTILAGQLIVFRRGVEFANARDKAGAGR